ncbi:MAG: glycosyltransferase family 9 protein [Caulobacteraceae bacterium]
MSTKPFPILCILPGGVAEAVLSSGLIKRLHDEIPDAEFTIVSSLRAAALFRDTPGLAETIVWTPEGFRSWFALWRRVRGRKWGLVLDVHGGGLARFLSTKRRAVRKLGGDKVHKLVEYARLLRLEDEPPAPFLFTSTDTEARAAEILGVGGPILAMAPAAQWVGEIWPIERYSFTAIRLLGEKGPLPDGRLMILAGPDDWRAAEPLRRSLPRERWIDLAGEDLLTAYACLKRARLFIGGATGMMHLAAAAGCPTLGLFGPTDEALYAPWGDTARAVRGVRSFEAIGRIDPQLNQPVCHMFDLTLETVVGAATALLKDTETRPVLRQAQDEA